MQQLVVAEPHAVKLLTLDPTALLEARQVVARSARRSARRLLSDAEVLDVADEVAVTACGVSSLASRSDEMSEHSSESSSNSRVGSSASQLEVFRADVADWPFAAGTALSARVGCTECSELGLRSSNRRQSLARRRWSLARRRWSLARAPRDIIVAPALALAQDNSTPRALLPAVKAHALLPVREPLRSVVRPMAAAITERSGYNILVVTHE